jgi:RNA polymerase sigma-70 factor (ECF subfamily)
MRERSDETLMTEWAGGSLAAFETLYARYRGPLYRYFLRLVGDATQANDLYQGCWEKVIRARGQYRPDGPFRGWLFRIAHNHAMDGFRRRQPSTGLRDEEPDSSEPGPAARAESAERGQRLLDALAGLPPEQRDTVLLRLEAGLDLDAIARATGVGRETAKSRLRYGVARLKQALQGDRTE